MRLPSGRLALRDAWRAILWSRASSLAAILILSLSMAAGAVTFAVVDTIVLRPLPYPDSSRLADISMRTQKTSRGVVSPVDYLALTDQTFSFESIGAWTTGRFEMSDTPGLSEPMTSVVATASLLHVLRAKPVIGTLFTEANEVTGGDEVALISEGLWERRYGRDPGVLGAKISTPTGAVTVIGVMPKAFVFPIEAQTPPMLWRPLVVRPEHRVITPSSGRISYLQVLGRLKGGVSIEQARSDVDRVFASQAALYPGLYEDQAPRTDLLQQVLTDRVAGWMRLVLAAVVVLMAIACVNVANLLLTRSLQRARDVAIRLSLGATGLQVMAGLLIESLLLAAIATAAGLAAAAGLLRIVRSALPAGIVRADAVQLDGRVFAACALAAAATAVVAGLVPGWQASRVAAAQVLKDGSGATAGPGRRRWQGGLLVTQVALVTMLVAAATLLVASFARVLGTDLGFSRHNLAAVPLAPEFPPGPDRAAAIHDFYSRVDDAVRAVPGVASVATLAGGPLPLYTGALVTRISSPDVNRAPVPADLRRVSPGYFETAGIRIIEGRGFTDADRGKRVAVIDELGARHLFDGESAIGRRLSAGGLTVIGVAANVKLLGPEGATQPQLYMQLIQEELFRTLLIRSSTPIAGVAPAIEAAVTSITGGQPRPVKVEITEEQFRLLTADRRFNAGLMTVLGLVALLIAVSGIYATTAAMVAQRTREIGIRMALGASASRVVWNISGVTARLLALGAFIGLLAAWAVSGVLESVVFGIRPTDALAYLVPLAIIAVGGWLAALVPAVQAARVDPLVTLRGD
ncbi:MAG: ADOP family duplicated permease [Acidobacteriota bacterium]|nr:ADOP family duplicated permease [Acidobacteriota bacterium]